MAVALLTIVPWTATLPPSRPPYLDTSWEVELHRAFLDHRLFGQDIVFTFGPWGFLTTDFSVPGTYVWGIAFWAACAMVLSWGAISVARDATSQPAVGAAWIALLVVVAWQGVDAVFVVVAGLFLVTSTGSQTSRHRLNPVVPALCLVLSWFGLTKFTYFLVAAGVMTLVLVNDLVRDRRVGPLLPLYILGTFAAWIAAAQSPGGLPTYLKSAVGMTRGYGAMASQVVEPQVGAAFVLMAAVLVLATAQIDLRTNASRFPLLSLAVLLVLFVYFKLGFVRAEPPHPAVALTALLALAAVLLPLLLPGVGRGRLGVVTLVGVTVVGVIAWVGLETTTDVHPMRSVHTRLSVIDDALVAIARPDRARRERSVDWARFNAAVRRHVPLPSVTGSVDLYPNDQLVVSANGLDSEPRPVLQSYAAYTETLAARNAEDLRSRPRGTVFVDIQPIDFRWPTTDDAPSLLTILSSYRLVGESSAYLRFDYVRWEDAERIGLATTSARLDSEVRVPSLKRGPIWVEIDLKSTLFGRVEELLYKPATVYIDARLANGSMVTHRLVPHSAGPGSSCRRTSPRDMP